MNKPKVPKRSKQLKFACTIATAWIGVTIYLLYSGSIVSSTVLGVALVLTASSAAFLDFCVPSFIYNKFVNRKKRFQYLYFH
jgi:hypothetical protein